MSWPDITITLAQVVMFIALMPTLRDPHRWPHPLTAGLTGGSLVSMGVALWSANLRFSAFIVGGLACCWLIMSIQPRERWSVRTW